MKLCDWLYHPDRMDQTNDLLKNGNITSALDIGCSHSISLFQLYHNLFYDRLVGVEENSFEKTIEDSKKYYENLPEIKSPYDLYKFLITFNPPFEERDFHVSETDFPKIFDYRFNTPAHTYLNNTTEIFGTIILSNVLHLNFDWQDLLDACIPRIKPGGLIYVSVNHPENPKVKDHKQIEIGKEEFTSLLNNKFETLFIDTDFYSKTEPKYLMSRIFIGKKI